MRVLFATGIYPPENGGPASLVPELAADAVAHGHVVDVLTYGDEATHAASAWQVKVVPRGGGVVARYFRYLIQVWQLLRTADGACVQGTVSEGIPTTLANCIVGKTMILRVPGDYAWEAAQRRGETRDLEGFLTGPVSWRDRMLRCLQTWVAGNAMLIITPSRYLASVVERWGIPAQRIRVIYNAVERHAPDQSPEALRGEYGLGSSRVLLAGGRLVSWKRIDHLLRVLQRRPQNECLVVVGDGPSRVAWEGLARELGVSDRVIWAGACSKARLAAWYRTADLFLLPSSYEGLSHMALEAASEGCGVIVSDMAGNPEAAELMPERIHVAAWQDEEAWVRALSAYTRTLPVDGERLREAKEYQLSEYRRVYEEVFTRPDDAGRSQ